MGFCARTAALRKARTGQRAPQRDGDAHDPRCDARHGGEWRQSCGVGALPLAASARATLGPIRAPQGCVQASPPRIWPHLPCWPHAQAKYDCFVFDCDGTLWKGNTLIPGAKEALQLLRDQVGPAARRKLRGGTAGKSARSAMRRRTHLAAPPAAPPPCAAQGKRVLFVTNNSTKSRRTFKLKFDSLGLPAAQVGAHLARRRRPERTLCQTAAAGGAHYRVRRWQGGASPPHTHILL